MTRPIEVSVVMPCFNAEAWLRTQLESLVRQEMSHSWEIVVADNGSTDSSLEILEAFRDRLPSLNVIDASASRGIGFARNRGVEAARGRKPDSWEGRLDSTENAGSSVLRNDSRLRRSSSQMS